MGYQERRIAMIAKRAAPHLQEGEQIQTGAIAQSRRPSRFGKPTGMYHAIELDRTYWVHRQYHKELATADEALTAMQSDGDH